MKSVHTGADLLDAGVIGANLRDLRRRAHLTQGEFAQRLGMRQGPVCNIEQGKNLPSAQVLHRMAQVLKVTTDHILRPERYTADTGAHPQSDAPASGPGLPVIHGSINPSLYLTSSSVRLDPGTAFTADVESVVRDYLALEDLCQVPRRARIPLQLGFDADATGIERVATQCRALLGIGDAVVFDLLELFENHGLRVTFMQFPDAGSASFSCYDAQNGNVFIFVHAANNPEKQIFALAYELGRILLFNRALLFGRDPFAEEAVMHKNARYFAACFLMPAAAVRNSAGQTGVRHGEWDFELLLRLKHRFGVSAETFNYRLLELGLVTAGVQARLRKAITEHYQASAYGEPGKSRRILSPNGRLGDLLHIVLRRDVPEAAAIASRLASMKIEMP